MTAYRHGDRTPAPIPVPLPAGPVRQGAAVGPAALYFGPYLRPVREVMPPSMLRGAIFTRPVIAL